MLKKHLLRNYRRLILGLKRAFYLATHDISFKHKGVPYFSQWESRELVGPIIRKECSAQKDPLWQKSGAKSPEEYTLWSWNACGMACFKMILAYIFGKEVSIVELGKKCMEYGGYRKNKNSLDGLFYKPFLEFVKAEFNLDGRIISPMLREDIICELNSSNYIIASVSHEIRRPQSIPAKKGGHLVLILGFDVEKEIFFIHNPSGDTEESQEYAQISFEDFEKFFAEGGIVISNSQVMRD